MSLIMKNRRRRRRKRSLAPQEAIGRAKVSPQRENERLLESVLAKQEEIHLV
jgi:hypothetical protein